jgi:hypothetical protein
MNSLHIELVAKHDYDTWGELVVRLTCGSEVRIISYEWGTWDYLGGDIEPYIPYEVRNKWYGKAGDEALQGLWNGDFTHTVIE